MAVGKWKLYDKAKLRIGDGTFDMDSTSNWKIAFFTSASNCNTLSVGTGVYGDLTNELANGNGYTTGGIALTGVTWTESSGTVSFDCDDAAMTASGATKTWRYCVIYQNATLNGIVKPLLCVELLDTTPADVSVTDTNTATIQMPAGGLFDLSGAITD
jgi:hypothetical protein